MFKITVTGVKQALAVCDPKVVQQAVRTTLKRTADSGRTTASEEIRKHYNVKKSDLDPRIKVTPPRADNMTAIIGISGRGMSLSYFGARQITGSRVLSRKGKSIGSSKVTRKMKASGPVPQGVLVQVLKGKNTPLLRRAFLAKMKSGHIGVFRRLDKKRLPIEEKNVISIPSMAENANVMPRVLRKIQEKWDKEFPHQLKFYQDRARR
jgi:hypothetical protein